MRPRLKAPIKDRRRLLMNVLTGSITLAIGTILWNWPAGPTAAPPPGGVGAEGRSSASNDLLRAAAGTLPGAVPSNTPLVPQLPPPSAEQLASQKVEVAARVARGMEDWRLAIRNRNPEVVEAMDRAFAESPRDFTPALLVSAETDPDERVRAFSTRVLGKLRSPESQPLMRRLLGDASEYVRFNAAWALGELADRDAVAELRRLVKRDRSEMVRQAANDSLRRLTGG